MLRKNPPKAHPDNEFLPGGYCGPDCMLDAWSRGYPDAALFELGLYL